MEKTPLFQALNQYIQQDYARFHMPGHKGFALPPLAAASQYDVTEVEGTDSLFEAEGPLAQLEDLFSQLYGTKRTLLSAGGSTLCIQTMLSLVARPGGEIIAGRNIHSAAVNAMALLDLHPCWLYPQQEGQALIGRIEPSQVKQALQQHPKACAVYITCPDYFGEMSDIAAISTLCRQYRVPLLVDNAHGAHLKFMEPSLHPMDLGADICCDSLHKTLPVLTGGALLHFASESLAQKAKERMSVFGSTSPNYLIMLSCDTAAGWLAGPGPGLLRETARRCAQLKELAQSHGMATSGGLCDPMRLTLVLSGSGYTKEAFRSHLRRHGIMEEFLSENGCALLCSPFNREEDYLRIKQMLEGLCLTPCPASPFPMFRPRAVLSLREALFAPCETLPIEKTAGRIAAQIKAPCPPGIPIVMLGEEINKNYIKTLKMYGISFLSVVK